MPGSLEPILPKRRVGPSAAVVLAKLTGALNQFGLGVIDRQSKYPPQSPRTRYRRTGEYGRRWTKRGPRRSGRDLVVEAGTNLSYAPYVGGFRARRPRQTRGAARAGWTSVQDSAATEWKGVRPQIVRALRGG